MVRLTENNFSRRHGRNTRPKIRAIRGLSPADPHSSTSSVAQNHLLFVDRCSSFVERSADNWQAIETRTNGTADSNVTSQIVWSASYINAAVLQDTYTAGGTRKGTRKGDIHL